MDLPPVNCPLCGKRTTEYCSTLACRACHKSLTLEKCLDDADAYFRKREPELWALNQARLKGKT